MKHSTACKQCKTSKRKCERETFNSTCVACRNRRQVCSYIQTRQPRFLELFPATPCTRSSSSRNGEAILPLEMRLDLTDLYIRNIHERPHSLFHERSLRIRIQNNTLPDELVFAICSLGCRFSSDPARRSLHDRLFSFAKAAFQACFGSIELERVQSALLLCVLASTSQERGLEVLYLGTVNQSHERDTCLAD